MSVAWEFGGVIVGGVVFFASRLVLGTGWLWWIIAFSAWGAIAGLGAWKAKQARLAARIEEQTP